MHRVFVLAAAAILAACTPPGQQNAESPVSPAARSALAQVSAPAADARVTSPLSVSGVAPADWFFENQFPVRLVDAQGEELAFAPATPRVNWTEPGDKEFDARVEFSVATDTPAILLLEEDMPGDGVEPRQVRIPVVLAPNP